jgi:hypothetical protein
MQLNYQKPIQKRIDDAKSDSRYDEWYEKESEFFCHCFFVVCLCPVIAGNGLWVLLARLKPLSAEILV